VVKFLDRNTLSVHYLHIFVSTKKLLPVSNDKRRDQNYTFSQNSGKTKNHVAMYSEPQSF